ncbi:MAG: hypothetical protein MH204_11815, partial [Fimbriimonadaceae bacterium]|nr:hypothetical protein [Fimbriimonadaceae bacterium]
LTFPAGGIEPDPALEPDAAAEHRAAWPDFEPMLGRLNVPVVQAWVSGVHHPAAARIARALFPRSPDPAWTAATIQLLLPKLMKTRIRIEFRTWE